MKIVIEIPDGQVKAQMECMKYYHKSITLEQYLAGLLKVGLNADLEGILIDEPKTAEKIIKKCKIEDDFLPFVYPEGL